MQVSRKTMKKCLTTRTPFPQPNKMMRKRRGQTILRILRSADDSMLLTASHLPTELSSNIRRLRHRIMPRRCHALRSLNHANSSPLKDQRT